MHISGKWHYDMIVCYCAYYFFFQTTYLMICALMRSLRDWPDVTACRSWAGDKEGGLLNAIEKEAETKWREGMRYWGKENRPYGNTCVAMCVGVEWPRTLMSSPPGRLCLEGVAMGDGERLRPSTVSAE